MSIGLPAASRTGASYPSDLASPSASSTDSARSRWSLSASAASTSSALSIPSASLTGPESRLSESSFSSSSSCSLRAATSRCDSSNCTSATCSASARASSSERSASGPLSDVKCSGALPRASLEPASPGRDSSTWDSSPLACSERVSCAAGVGSKCVGGATAWLLRVRASDSPGKTSMLGYSPRAGAIHVGRCCGSVASRGGSTAASTRAS